MGNSGDGGNNPSVLVGQWVYGSGNDGIKKLELFKDSTGIAKGKGISWKTEDKRLVILSSAFAFACDYEISGYELALVNDDGDSTTLVRRENLEEFIAKQAAEKAKKSAEQAKQNKQQIEQILGQYFVTVIGGTFTMGCTTEQDADCSDNEKPAHSVTVNDFSIGKYEVTQKLWGLVMGNNPSRFKGDNLPVEYVSWDDVRKFMSKLNEMTGKNYRLPTEAEWEFAARGGNKSQGYIYSGSNTIGDVAWYSANSGNQTHPVGQKQPNELGIYDMSGNVWEWCSDWYGEHSASGVVNPTGPSSGTDRIVRGGSWSDDAQRCRVAPAATTPRPTATAA